MGKARGAGDVSAEHLREERSWVGVVECGRLSCELDSGGRSAQRGRQVADRCCLDVDAEWGERGVDGGDEPGAGVVGRLDGHAHGDVSGAREETGLCEVRRLDLGRARAGNAGREQAVGGCEVGDRRERRAVDGCSDCRRSLAFENGGCPASSAR